MAKPSAVAFLAALQGFPTFLFAAYFFHPDSLYWHNCYWSIAFGWCAFVFYGVGGLLGYIPPSRALLMTFELGFGGVVPVYLCFDYHRTVNAVSCKEQSYAAQTFASIPTILMSKHMGRSVSYLLDEKAAIRSWHFPVDMAEICMFLAMGLWRASDSGEIFFLIYNSSPAVCSSLYANHIVMRMRSLLRSNARLMQTTFSAVVRIDIGRHSGRVLESDAGFDVLIDGKAEGAPFYSLFAAEEEDFQRLCSIASDDGERIVRRLRTTLFSRTRSFQQDVELRVLAATEEEAQYEQGLLLGVSVMGERLPVNETSHPGPSLLLEQSLDEVGQLRISASEESSSDLHQISEIGAFDSVSFTGVRPTRRRPQSFSRYSSSSQLSPAPSIRSDSSNKLLRSEAALRGAGEVNRPAYDAPWLACCEKRDHEYLKQCSASMVEDLITSWNYPEGGCCHWHMSLDRLSRLVREMKHWRICSDVWPSGVPKWQCNQCSALQFEDPGACWLCFHADAEDDKANSASTRSSE